MVSLGVEEEQGQGLGRLLTSPPPSALSPHQHPNYTTPLPSKSGALGNPGNPPNDASGR